MGAEARYTPLIQGHGQRNTDLEGDNLSLWIAASSSKSSSTAAVSLEPFDRLRVLLYRLFLLEVPLFLLVHHFSRFDQSECSISNTKEKRTPVFSKKASVEKFHCAHHSCHSRDRSNSNCDQGEPSASGNAVFAIEGCE